MKKTFNILYLLLTVLSMTFVSCEDKIDPLVEELQFERVFTPLNLKAFIRNKTNVELQWDLRSDAEYYIVEFSEDSLVFGSIIATETVQREEVPFTYALEGETRYSARVKGVQENGAEDSNWAEVTFITDPENIYLPIQDGDIDALEATVRWTPGAEVTHLLITPGDVTRTLTDEEKAAGVATITGLSAETSYAVTLYRNTKKRGTVTFETLVDVGDATRVYETDNLQEIIAAASAGDVLVLYPGDYSVYEGKITINKNITIRGLYPYNKPVVHVQFELEDGVQSAEIRDIEMNGNYMDTSVDPAVPALLDHAFEYATTGMAYGSLMVQGCVIHDYNKSLIAGSSSVASTISSITMDDCIVTNILTNSADCIDVRAGYVAALTLTNSTFNNCAPGRDFVRLDDTSGTYPGMNTDVLIDHCTFYGVSNNNGRRILYVRFVTNTLTVKNSIFAETAGYYTNQSRSAQPVCTNNNYFNALGFWDTSYRTDSKVDISGNYRTLDPGFANAASGNFSVSNQTLRDNAVGDPRWLP